MALFFDSHAHMTSDAVFENVDAILERAKMVGVENILNICTDLITLERGVALREKYPWVLNAAATTPHDVAQEGEAHFPVMEQHARQGLLAAVGETGLDYHYNHSQPEIQKEFLRRYLRLALDCRLPIIIHCREAFADLFAILDSDYMVNGTHAPGVLHCFTGTVKEAEGVLQRGWYLSLSGIVTFKKSDELRSVAKMMPLDKLLIETDTPYLAPQSRRGAVNEPAFVTETAATIANIKGISLDEVAKATRENGAKLFKIKKENSCPHSCA